VGPITGKDRRRKKMADMKSALKFLRENFPQAAVGVDNTRPYAKFPNGEMYGILFGEPGDPHAGDPIWARGPVAIIKFQDGKIGRNWEVEKWLPVQGEK